SLLFGNGGGNTFTVGDSNNTVFSGAITGTDASDFFIKVGSGTLELAGTGGNGFLGTTEVDAGELDLHESGGNAVSGPLVIGDGTGTDIVKLLANNQIGDTSPVTINSSGVLDLNGFSDTFGLLTLDGGDVKVAGTSTITVSGGTTVNNPSTLDVADNAN